MHSPVTARCSFGPNKPEPRPLCAAAIALCNCRVNPDQWVEPFAKHLTEVPPTFCVPLLTEVVGSPWLQREEDLSVPARQAVRYLESLAGAPGAIPLCCWRSVRRRCFAGDASTGRSWRSGAYCSRAHY